MLFLADENLHAGLVRWLRSRGHDVSYAAETRAGEPDEIVLRRARAEGRILITDDKDFGELVVRKGLGASGVLLLRLRTPLLADRIARLDSLWASIERKMPQNLVVVSDRRVRVRPIGEGPAGGGGRAPGA